MKIWLISARSDSGDDYYNFCCWRNEPTQEHINEALTKVDCEVADDLSDDFDFIVDGKKYRSYCMNYVISEVEL